MRSRIKLTPQEHGHLTTACARLIPKPTSFIFAAFMNCAREQVRALKKPSRNSSRRLPTILTKHWPMPDLADAYYDQSTILRAPLRGDAQSESRRRKGH